MDNLLTVHFHSMHGDYSRYSMWKWLDGYWGEEAHFSREDDFGLVGQVTSPSNRFIDSVNLLVKTEDWSRQTHDYRVRRFLGAVSYTQSPSPRDRTRSRMPSSA